MVKILILLFSAFFAGCASAPTPDGEWIQYYQAETTKPYNDVVSELKIAITENNFRITGHSHVGKVIRQRENIEFPDYDTIQFCNLTHAKTLLLISPESVRHMPCNIVTYTLDDKVIVQTRLLPTNTDNSELNQFSQQMNNLLKEIVDFTVEE